mmetsp:Transcript_98406/g.263024  ORF Transcript_98406/g.263024 Transcript_98406/m.263024 type:complete len:408 (+) Transcript_98406:336-1559(+)
MDHPWHGFGFVPIHGTLLRPCPELLLVGMPALHLRKRDAHHPTRSSQRRGVQVAYSSLCRFRSQEVYEPEATAPHALLPGTAERHVHEIERVAVSRILEQMGQHAYPSMHGQVLEDHRCPPVADHIASLPRVRAEDSWPCRSAGGGRALRRANNTPTMRRPGIEARRRRLLLDAIAHRLVDAFAIPSGNPARPRDRPSRGHIIHTERRPRADLFSSPSTATPRAALVACLMDVVARSLAGGHLASCHVSAGGPGLRRLRRHWTEALSSAPWCVLGGSTPLLPGPHCAGPRASHAPASPVVPPGCAPMGEHGRPLLTLELRWCSEQGAGVSCSRISREVVLQKGSRHDRAVARTSGRAGSQPAVALPCLGFRTPSGCVGSWSAVALSCLGFGTENPARLAIGKNRLRV